jgi:hypothetical protein
MLPKPDILVFPANNMNTKANLIILIVITTVVLVTGTRTVFADSTTLNQETRQNANCDTVGANSPVSDSCNQAQNNANVNNGGVVTNGKQGPTTGTLLVKKVCANPGGLFCDSLFTIAIVDSSNHGRLIQLRDGENQSITLAPGRFEISEDMGPLAPTYSGYCMQVDPFDAIGTISGGQHLTCTLTNTRF